MTNKRKEKFEAEVARLADVLQKESSISLSLVQEVVKNVNESNIISFLDIVLYGIEKKGTGWKRYGDAKIVVEQLVKIGVIRDDAVKKLITSASEMGTVLFMSAIERVAENIDEFMQKCLRSFWGTENGTCPNCGTDHDSDSLFCDQCGAKVPNRAWDASARRLTTEIMKDLMKDSGKRYYYAKKEEGKVYGSFYKSNLSNRDIDYIVGALNELNINVTNADDRIFFDTARAEHNDDLLITIKEIAGELRFQELDGALA